MRKLIALTENEAGQFLAGCLLLLLVIVTVVLAEFIVGTLGPLF